VYQGKAICGFTGLQVNEYSDLHVLRYNGNGVNDLHGYRYMGKSVYVLHCNIETEL